MQLSWEIEGERQLSRRLRIVADGITDFSKPFRRASDGLVRTFSKDVFATEGAAVGEKWKRLSPYTIAQKARQGFPADPLVRTGRMRRSFKRESGKDYAMIYNTAEYFKYHQSNKPRSSRLPRRVMMKLGETQKTEVVREFQKYIRSVINQTI